MACRKSDETKWAGVSNLSSLLVCTEVLATIGSQVVGVGIVDSHSIFESNRRCLQGGVSFEIPTKRLRPRGTGLIVVL